MKTQSRRSFLGKLGGLSASAFLLSYADIFAKQSGKVKITDIKTMVFQAPGTNYASGRTFTLVKVETDAGIFGIAEAYGTPGLGIKEAIHGLKEMFIGKDPIQIDRLYTGYRYTDGSAHAQQRAMSGIEMALWDLAGKILDVPTHSLMGGKFRDRVRLYDHHTPKDYNDKIACKDWADAAKERPNGITIHKLGIPRTNASNDFGYDPSNRMLSSKGMRLLIEAYENCREAIGWDHDLMIGCHWEFDLRTAIDLARGLESVKPLWLEDPLPVAWSESWKRLAEMSPVPISTGENWMRRQESMPFITNAAIDIVHLDLRNSGGFLENKRIADLADLYSLPVANHNTGSIVNGMASVNWGSSIRDYMACETVYFDGGKMDDIILHDGPLCKDGYVTVPDKPGLGIELNPDVVKAHLVSEEIWWG
ncbi:MAG: mandelate racemase/muconate lactonizing enzyme family protein [Cyclobacteriaceae bacterium]|jgi:L-alanine-DL-glutamate epimerase-like enolase superfamily enzyme|nr:mandelate racemase/muconate lactonizing enzyme family protein [Cyclobacteriaceae bacterium]